MQYFYITNQLGDIIGITDPEGRPIIRYTYDEWGAVLLSETRDNTAEQKKIAEINPLRYRGYYYDSETGYYYLQSRYYNPEWGRFLSPDAFSYIDNSTRLGFNAYIYCTNNPVMFVDHSGTQEDSNPNITEQGKAVAHILVEILKKFSELVSKAVRTVTEAGKAIAITITEIFVCLDLQEISKKLHIEFSFDSFEDYLQKKVDLYRRAFNELSEFINQTAKNIVTRIADFVSNFLGFFKNIPKKRRHLFNFTFYNKCNQ